MGDWNGGKRDSCLVTVVVLLGGSWLLDLLLTGSQVIA